MKKPILTGMLLASLLFMATKGSAQSSSQKNPVNSQRSAGSKVSSALDNYMAVNYPGSNYVITNTVQDKNLTNLFIRMDYGLLLLQVTNTGAVVQDIFKPF